MREYKKGDKVVVEIEENHPGYSFIKCGNSVGHVLDNKEILYKLEDFQSTEEKIKFTVEEKEEFDILKANCVTLRVVLTEIFERKNNYYKYLSKKIMCFNNDESNKAQLEFARAWEKPSRIEVVETESHAVDINGARLYKFGNKWSFDKGVFVRLTLDEVKEAEKQLGIQGLQDKWHEVAKGNKAAKND